MTRQKLMTPREAAIYYSVTARTITAWCRAGDFEAMKVGRVWRIKCFEDGSPIRYSYPR